MLALTKLSTRVVRPKPDRPSGAGFAGIQLAEDETDEPVLAAGTLGSLIVANFSPLLREYCDDNHITPRFGVGNPVPLRNTPLERFFATPLRHFGVDRQRTVVLVALGGRDLF